MTDLRLHLLGVPFLERAEQPIPLTIAKGIALLAWLALTPGPQPRERLVDLLWPDSLPDAARKNLRNTLWALRKEVGEGALDSGGERLTLRDALWVDARAFQQGVAAPDVPTAHLRAVVDSYRGSLADGLTLADAPDFELWLIAERERLEQLYLRAVEALVERYRRAGAWGEIVTVARRALIQDPLQEPLHRALMEAHAQLGERPEALRQFDSARAILMRELGVEPLPETEALRQRIVQGDFSAEASPPLPSLPARRPPPSRRPTVPFIGRQAELAALTDEWERATAGEARVLLLTGEMGIGKTRLWQEWRATLPPHALVLEAQCLPSTQSLPFAPLITLFSGDPLCRELFSGQARLSSVWLAEMARLLPELREAWPALPVPLPLPPDEERRRLFEAFVQVLRALGARPLLLFLDDAHWADQATLDWLAFLLHRMGQEALLLVLAYRPEDASAPLANLLAHWARQAVVRRLPLSLLTEAEAASLLMALLPSPPPGLATLKAQSAGNPYFLIELAQAAPGDVPPALTELIQARLERLPDPARQVVQAAAILEPSFDLPALRRTSGRAEEEVLDALDALLGAGVLAERWGRYAFAHPLVATVVGEGLSSARRAFLHRRAAEARESVPAEQLPAWAAALVVHHREAGNPQRAAHFAQMAAERALALAAPVEAIDFFHQALALDPTPAREVGLGRALYARGELEEARAAFKRALEGYEQQGDPAGIVRANLEMAALFLPMGRGDEVRRWVGRALAALDVERQPEEHAQAHFLLGAGLGQSDGSLAEAEEHLNEAARLATEHSLGRVAARSRFELGNLLARRGNLQAAVQAFQQSIALSDAEGDPLQSSLAHNNTAYHLLLLGDQEGALKHVEAGLFLAESRDFLLPRQYLYSTRGEIALAAQQWDEAEAWLTRGLAEAERQGNRTQAVAYQANLALAERGRGDLDSALLRLDSARAAARDLPDPHLQTQIDLWLAELHQQRGERAAALSALARAEARLASGERAGLRAWAARLREGSESYNETLRPK